MSHNGNGNKDGCGHDLVAYIYDEIGPRERRRVETHIAECPVCTLDLAGFTSSRAAISGLRDEFARLSPPDIVLPVIERAQEEHGVWSSIGRFINMTTARHALAAAALLVCLGAGWAILFPGGQGEVAVQPPVDRPDVNLAAIDISSAPAVEVVPVVTSDLESKDEVSTGRAFRSERRRSRVSRARTGARAQETGATARRIVPVASPSLSGIEETSDNSLRLTDLFDDIGG